MKYALESKEVLKIEDRLLGCCFVLAWWQRSSFPDLCSSYLLMCEIYMHFFLGGGNIDSKICELNCHSQVS